MTPTSRSLQALRAEGWTADKVEQRLPIPGRYVTRDVGGFGDILAWKPGSGILMVQATSGSNVSSRVLKASNLPTARAWLLAGGMLQVWGWRKAGARGQRKTWQRRIVKLIERDGQIVEDESLSPALGVTYRITRSYAAVPSDE